MRNIFSPHISLSTVPPTHIYPSYHLFILHSHPPVFYFLSDLLFCYFSRAILQTLFYKLLFLQHNITFVTSIRHIMFVVMLSQNRLIFIIFLAIFWFMRMLRKLMHQIICRSVFLMFRKMRSAVDSLKVVYVETIFISYIKSLRCALVVH